MMRTRLSVNVHAPAAARRFVLSSVGPTDPDAAWPPVDDVVLVVSELVTNAVRAGAAGIDVELVVAEDKVELHVTDDAPGWPTMRHADWDELTGRGLAIVGDVVEAWHTTNLARGKRVTAMWSRTGAEPLC
jgi:anti-sigma regulatory factor (Ser/Thr protein kinase)